METTQGWVATAGGRGVADRPASKKSVQPFGCWNPAQVPLFKFILGSLQIYNMNNR